MSQHLPVSIVGAGMIHFGELFDVGYEEMLARAYQQVLGGVDKGLIALVMGEGSVNDA
jgi:hypothetical protein